MKKIFIVDPTTKRRHAAWYVLEEDRFSYMWPGDVIPTSHSWPILPRDYAYAHGGVLVRALIDRVKKDERK